MFVDNKCTKSATFEVATGSHLGATNVPTNVLVCNVGTNNG